MRDKEASSQAIWEISRLPYLGTSLQSFVLHGSDEETEPPKIRPGPWSKGVDATNKSPKRCTTRGGAYREAEKTITGNVLFGSFRNWSQRINIKDGRRGHGLPHGRFRQRELDTRYTDDCRNLTGSAMGRVLAIDQSQALTRCNGGHRGVLLHPSPDNTQEGGDDVTGKFHGPPDEISQLSQDEDLDCIQGLLSLSQGAWR
ncbi:homeobox transcription factor [Histoplasma capsulatum H143]|uniref:Homeobox transcription factor n=1 Tax=Ajellomyces capsulatus (strain H143) TaxID=544712 RepID=C6H5R3_AJECH|nr:homeobox transcription factor [Histoplasma capsulatum H143]